VDFSSIFPWIDYDPDMEDEPVRWLIDGIWQLGKINGMAGFEKSGKSRLLCWLLAGMYAGKVFSRAALPRKVGYLCGEETIPTANSRLKRYAKLLDVEAFMDIKFMNAPAMGLESKQRRHELLKSLLEAKRDMLVIDPLRRVHNADEDKSTVMSPIYNDIRQWSNKYNMTIVLLHHTPKIDVLTDMTRIASWFRGSTDLAAILDTAQYVDRQSKKRIQVLREGRFPPMDPLSIEDLGGRDVNDDRGFRLL